MIAAIYARKSTEQTGVAEDQRSVTRQVEHARTYAERNGWQVAEEHIYVDDGISGAEFKNRPGLVRLLNALQPTPGFQVVVMSEPGRVGREQVLTQLAFSQLADAGVEIWSYLDDKRWSLDTATDKFMLSVANFAAELEREKASQRTYDAMVRKARARQVTGGRVYGYDNLEVLSETPGPDGRRHRQVRDPAGQPDGSGDGAADLRALRGGAGGHPHRQDPEHGGHRPARPPHPRLGADGGA
jgi:DNA invertase Pin-like site-specific DNA recombinase